ncbi:hypothetical protein F4808DRAFT_469381 [Astrocystis sublimbata]|nr:hypothetical protein F4808DRAFT_469381 [Astrocystis sublimbata]
MAGMTFFFLFVSILALVISQNIDERKIGNRGSKSVLDYNTVKEQRVDVGFERGYHIKILSNPINFIRNLSTLESASRPLRGCPDRYPSLGADPFYITGFTDGEGSFMISIIKDNKYKTGWRVDLILLNKIKDFFNTGTISNSAYFLIKNKDHTTEDGLVKLVALRAGINKGLNEELLANFPDTVPILIPEAVKNPIISKKAEGCFSVVAVKLSFILTQRCGYTTLDDRGTIDFKVTNFSSIKDIIIPFFNQYCFKVVSLMYYKKHLTQEGLDEIKKIRDKMNTNRKQ